jgi:hypothetical protein
MSGQKMIDHARTFIGTPWRHRGRNRRGLDCVGLLILSANASGLAVADATHYGRDPWEDRLRKELIQRFGQPIWRQSEDDEMDWLPGDVALVCWYAGEPSHVGLIGNHLFGGLSLIHCENINGCVEHSLDGHHIDCITEVYRPWPVKSSQ